MKSLLIKMKSEEKNKNKNFDKNKELEIELVKIKYAKNPNTLQELIKFMLFIKIYMRLYKKFYWIMLVNLKWLVV